MTYAEFKQENKWQVGEENGDFHQNIKTWWLEAAKNSRRG